MNLFRLLNRLPRLKRWPLKCAILAAAVFLICFPRMTLFTRHVYRWRNPNTLIEPQAAALQPLLEELRLRMSPELSAVEALSTVEQFVYEKIAYKYDWINWGNTDYIPTVTEAVEAGQEDCDGRAVVAASLLRNFGFQADLVTDFTHVWVRTEHGDTMSPGDQTAIQAKDEGLAVQPDAALRLPGALAHGVAVFYLHRELIIVLVLWLMLVRPGRSRRRNALALVLLIGGLMLLRAGGANWRVPIVWVQWVGIAAIAAAFMATSALWQPDNGTTNPQLSG